MASQVQMAKPILERGFVTALLINFLWINFSEVVRYFAFVMPMMRDAFSMVPDAAPMNLPVFMIWGVWDTILVFAATAICWMIQDRFGRKPITVILSGTFVWATIFVILWLGLWNMNLAPINVVLVALPLAWLETVIAAFIVRWARDRRRVE